MKGLDFGRFALNMGVAAAMLAGCGGSQPPIGTPGAMPQSRAIAKHVERGGSWMLPEAKGSDLLYATIGCAGTCVLSYSSGVLAGSLTTYGQALCSDKTGDVFIVHDAQIIEYAHGGTFPIATLDLPGGSGSSCSIDPSTGNLAVVFTGSGADVAVFPNAEGTPRLYRSGLDSLFCGYDGSGDLFVDGYNGQDSGLSELQNGASAFTSLSMDPSLGQPGALQWDGKYMTYEGRVVPDLHVSRFTVSGSTVTVVGVTKFLGHHKRFTLTWIHSGHIFVPYPNHGTEAKQLGAWDYPEGGRIWKRYNFDTYQKQLYLQSVTYSVNSK